MEGLSERQYATRVGLSRGAIQKAKATGRLVLHADGSIDAVASDALRAEATDPSKIRKAPQPKLKPVPEAAVSAVGESLREQGLFAPPIADLLDVGGRERGTVLGKILGKLGLDPDHIFLTRDNHIETWGATATQACRALPLELQRLKRAGV